MKILYACRLFSGLETSVISKKWKPTGVPTIFKGFREARRALRSSYFFGSKTWFL